MVSLSRSASPTPATPAAFKKMRRLLLVHDEIIEARGEVQNFTSFLRVCCVRYLSLQILGGIPSDVSVPIWSLDANAVLAQERAAFEPLVPAI
jgi:hypothetical protein